MASTKTNSNQQAVGANLPQYYNDIGVRQILENFKDYDEKPVFDHFEKEVNRPDKFNFAVDFGEENAWCGFDLDHVSIGGLLNAPRPAELHTRWINIWAPQKQKETLMTIAKFYDFTPRLLGLMMTDPPKPANHNRGAPSHSGSSILSWVHHVHEKPTSPSLEESYDLESGGSSHLSDSTLLVEQEMVRNMNHWHIVNDVWHWSTVDWGRRYVCIGYNSLHKLKARTGTAEEADTADFDLPDAKRVWTWLILCEDKTVISVNEDPFPWQSLGNDSHRIRDETVILRRNLHNVFSQISLRHDTKPHNALSLLPIRRRIGNTEEETAHRPSDTPGLLFYCLFDDWYNSYSLVMRRDHQYAAELRRLREDMFQKAELNLVNRINNIGRQLSILKRVYNSYELIIDRVLEKQKATLASLTNSNILPGGVDQSQIGMTPQQQQQQMSQSRPQIPEVESLLGVPLSSAARVRFERLKDRIRLYAIAEIQECLDQKESLVMMNFNLIAIKESYSVERLTRVTLLLAKITILFMPVSLLTGYFSIQVPGAAFTFKGYWSWFGGILAASIVFLVGFGILSGTNDGQLIYRPLSRVLLDKAKRRKKNS